MKPTTSVVVAARQVMGGQLTRDLMGGGVEVLAVTHQWDKVVSTIEQRHPQVLLLDAQLDGRAGDIARAVMTRYPLPIIALVGDPAHRSASTADLTAHGVVDVLCLAADGAGISGLCHRIKVVSGVTVVRQPSRPARRVEKVRTKLVVIGASTGGPPAVATLLQGLAGLETPVAVVQHIHADFVEGFVDWLSTSTRLEVRMAREGERLRPGQVYVAAPDRHLRVRSDLTVELIGNSGALHCPSVDELFASVATNVGSAAIGVLLTGMGTDGAAGLRAMADAGAVTIVQDEQSSAVYGMPKAAIGLGAAQRVLALPDIARAVRESA